MERKGLPSVSAGFEESGAKSWGLPDPGSPAERISSYQGDFDRLARQKFLRRLDRTTQAFTVVDSGVLPGYRYATRLGHSFDTVEIGSAIASGLRCPDDTAWVIKTACLAHDLGTPGFGHEGEGVLDRCVTRAGGPGFEANALTLHLLAEERTFHRATLAACVKYPWTPENIKGESRKFGVFPSDKYAFEWCMERAHREEGIPRRCFESLVMELADDISYVTRDLCDAVMLGYLTKEMVMSTGFKNTVSAMIGKNADRDTDFIFEALEKWGLFGLARRDGMYNSQACKPDIDGFLQEFRSSWISAVANANREYVAVMPPDFENDLKVPDFVKNQIQTMKCISRKAMIEIDAQKPNFALREKIVEKVFLNKLNTSNKTPLEVACEIALYTDSRILDAYAEPYGLSLGPWFPPNRVSLLAACSR